MKNLEKKSLPESSYIVICLPCADNSRDGQLEWWKQLSWILHILAEKVHPDHATNQESLNPQGKVSMFVYSVNISQNLDMKA